MLYGMCSRKSRNSITHRPKIPLPYPNPDVHYRLTSRPRLIFIRKSSRYNDVKNLSRLNWEELESEGSVKHNNICMFPFYRLIMYSLTCTFEKDPAFLVCLGVKSLRQPNYSFLNLFFLVTNVWVGYVFG